MLAEINRADEIPLFIRRTSGCMNHLFFFLFTKACQAPEASLSSNRKCNCPRKDLPTVSLKNIMKRHIPHIQREHE